MADEAFPVSVSVDLSSKLGPWNPIHRFYGCDEPNYAYSPAGKRLLGELGKTCPQKPVHFRTHNLMTTGDGTPALKWGSTNLYTEDADGHGKMDFTIVDRIFQTYLDAGVKPYMQLGFMPKALSTHPEPYQYPWKPTDPYDRIFTGWAYPPNDYAKWGDIIFRWVSHCVEKWGKDEVNTWYFEVWNEANIGYWKGTPDEFMMLHDHAIAAVRHALPTARVGGPDCAGDGGRWSRNFIDHCLNGTNHATGQVGTPMDFISFHAKGSPKVVNGHVQMGISNQLVTVERGFAMVASNPRTKGLPIVIGESDPEGCAACQGPQLAYRNGTVYSSYTAACFARKIELADKHGVNFEGALTWAFLFDGQPLFAGFRVLASDMIDHAVLNVFRMFAKMDGDRVKSTSDNAVALDDIVKSGVRAKPDVGVLATSNGKSTAIMVWHYHDDDVTGPDASVTVSIKGLTPIASAKLTEYRIDETHGNAFHTWKELGSPATPSAEQLATIQKAMALPQVNSGEVKAEADGSAKVEVRLPRQGVSLLVVGG